MSGNLFAVGNTAPAIEPTPAAPSFADALAGTKAAPKPAAKKSSVPTLAAPPEIKEAVDQYQDAKTNKKQAEAVMDQAGETLAAFVRDALDADGYKGNYHNSYSLAGNRHQAKVIWANKWTLNPEDEGELAAILGESFPDLIKKRFAVTLRPEVFESEELQAELMGLIGEKFGQFFETKITLTPAENFPAEIYKVCPAESLPRAADLCAAV